MLAKSRPTRTATAVTPEAPVPSAAPGSEWDWPRHSDGPEFSPGVRGTPEAGITLYRIVRPTPPGDPVGLARLTARLTAEARELPATKAYLELRESVFAAEAELRDVRGRFDQAALDYRRATADPAPGASERLDAVGAERDRLQVLAERLDARAKILRLQLGERHQLAANQIDPTTHAAASELYLADQSRRTARKQELRREIARAVGPLLDELHSLAEVGGRFRGTVSYYQHVAGHVLADTIGPAPTPAGA